MIDRIISTPWGRAGAAIAGLVALALLIYSLKFVIVPLFLAFLIAYILDPVVDYFEKRRIPRTVTIGVLAATAILVLLSVPVILIPSVFHQANDLVKASTEQLRGGAEGEGNRIAEKVDEWLDQLPVREWVALMDEHGWGVPPSEEVLAHNPDEADADDAAPPAAEAVQEPEAATGTEEPAEPTEPTEDDLEAGEAPVEADDGFNARAELSYRIGIMIRENALQLIQAYGGGMAEAGQSAGATLTQLLASIGRGLVATLVFLANVALFGFVSVYLLKDFDSLISAARELIPLDYRSKTVEIVSRIDVHLRAFLRGQLAVALCLGAMYAIGLLIAGTPFGLFIAAFGAIAGFIPYLGIVLTVIPAVFLTLVRYGVDWQIAVVAATFIIAQALEGNVLTPKIVGKSVGLSEVWVILAVVVFGNLLGFLGLLLAVPIAATLKVLIVEAVTWYKASALYRPPAQPD